MSNLINLAVQVSRYLIIVLMVIYTVQSYTVFRRTNVRAKEYVFLRQNVSMFFLHFIAFLVMFLKTMNMTLAVFYGAQVIYLAATLILFKNLYPKASKLLINNMCMLLTVGFIMVTRLSADHSCNQAIKQFKIVVAGTAMALIIPVALLDRSYLRFGTLINMFMLGIIADFWYALLGPLAIFAEPSLPLRGLLLASGVVLTCLSCSLYMSSRLGMGPYDAIGWILSERSGGKVPFRVVRILIDACAVTIGFACGSIVGLGTLVLACGTGPLIEFFNQKVSLPLLYGERH